MQLSVIAPLYNEEDSVGPLYDGIVAALDPLGIEYEILFVDDGSRDRTFARAEALARRDPRLRVVKFRRNYGQTPAMVAGIEYARGEILVTLDGDLQNDPGDIPAFLDTIGQGYDIVVGWRHRRQDKLITRKIPSRIANWLIGRITGVPIRDNGCSLKAYRASVIKHIPLYSEMHRFIPAMASLAGARIREIRVRHHARRFGESKYGLSRIYKVLLDLVSIKTILSFLARPMQAFVLAAIAPALIGVGTMASGVFLGVTGQAGASIVLLGIGALWGMLALMLILWGVLAELVYRTGDQKIEDFARLRVEKAS